MNVCWEIVFWQDFQTKVHCQALPQSPTEGDLSETIYGPQGGIHAQNFMTGKGGAKF
jgi:hypothetical protein